MSLVTNSRSGGQSEEPNEWELGGIRVPGSLLRGTPLVKFSEKKGKAPRERLFRLDANQGRMLWDSKRRGVSKCLFLHLGSSPLT